MLENCDKVRLQTKNTILKPLHHISLGGQNELREWGPQIIQSDFTEKEIPKLHYHLEFP